MEAYFYSWEQFIDFNPVSQTVRIVHIVLTFQSIILWIPLFIINAFL